MNGLRYFLANPVVRGAIAGGIVAIHLDIEAFKSFKSFDEFARYKWSTAAFRFLQGALNGAGVVAGIAGF